MISNLPASYEEFIIANGLCAGFLVTDGKERYFILWSEDEMNAGNVELEVCTHAPGYVAFAGDGGGGIYAFDKLGAVFILTSIGMPSEFAIKIADNFLSIARGFQFEGAIGE